VASLDQKIGEGHYAKYSVRLSCLRVSCSYRYLASGDAVMIGVLDNILGWCRRGIPIHLSVKAWYENHLRHPCILIVNTCFNLLRPPLWLQDDVCFMTQEFIPDMSIQNPEEAVMRQHMREEIYDLLRGLDSREKQVMVLRYGFKDNQPKSLAEIGRLFRVSKERVRKIEKKIMIKLRDEGIRRNLSRYMIL